MKNLIDFNENDVIVVVAQNIQLCFKATDALQSATSHIPKHKQNLTNVTDGLKDQVSNRADIVRERRGELQAVRGLVFAVHEGEKVTKNVCVCVFCSCVVRWNPLWRTC